MISAVLLLGLIPGMVVQADEGIFLDMGEGRKNTDLIEAIELETVKALYEDSYAPIVPLSDTAMTFDIYNFDGAWAELTVAAVINLGDGRIVETSELSTDMFRVTGRHARASNNTQSWSGTRFIKDIYASTVDNWGTPAAEGQYIVLEFYAWGPFGGDEMDGRASIQTHVYQIVPTAGYENLTLKDGSVVALSLTQNGNTAISPVIDLFKLEVFSGRNHAVYRNEAAQAELGPLPLVVHIHGNNQAQDWRNPLSYSNNATYFARPENQAKYPCHVLAPSSGSGASLGAGVADNIVNKINAMVLEGAVDPDRIYITGYSMGGSGVFQSMAAAHNNNAINWSFAAAVPICPQSTSALTQTIANNLKDTPLWAFVSLGDTSPVNALNNFFGGGIGSSTLTNARYTFLVDNKTTVWPYSPAEWLPYMARTLVIPGHTYQNLTVATNYTGSYRAGNVFPDGHWLFDGHQAWIPIFNNPLRPIDGYDGIVAPGYVTSGRATNAATWNALDVKQSEYDWMIDWMFAQTNRIVHEDLELSFDVRSESYAWSEKTMAVVIDLGEGRVANTSDLTNTMFTAVGQSRRVNNNALVNDWGRHGTRVINRVYASEINNWNNPADSGRYIVVEFKSWGGNIFNSLGQGTALATHDGGQALLLSYTVTANTLIPLADGSFIGTSASFNQTEHNKHGILANNHISPIIDQFIPTISRTVGGGTLTYSTFYNRDADGEIQMNRPLFIHLHGGGQGSHWRQPLGYSNNATVLAEPEWQARYGAHILVPLNSGNAQLDSTAAVVREMIAEGLVDPNRVYVSGYSMGGQGTINMMLRHPELIAAAVPICPASMTMLNATNIQTIADIPQWWMVSEGEYNRGGYQSIWTDMETFFGVPGGYLRATGTNLNTLLASQARLGLGNQLNDVRYTRFLTNKIDAFPYGPDQWLEYMPHNEITEDGYWIFNGHQGWIPVFNGGFEIKEAYDSGYAPRELYDGFTPGDSTAFFDWMFGFNVTFDANGGEFEGLTKVRVGLGSPAAVPAVPTRAGCTFKGWYLDGEEFDFSTPITGDITLVAQWYAGTIRITENGSLAAAMVAVTRNSVRTFSVTPIPADASIMGNVTWSVNNTNLTTVDQNGVVTVKGIAGNVTLTVRTAAGLTHSIVLRIT